MTIKVFGPHYSTYVRTVLITLQEKGAPYELVEVDMLGGEHRQPAHLARNPFGPVPAFEHDGFVIYETQAIIRYLDRILPTPKLTPADAKAEARMNQIMGIVDSFAYGSMISKIFMQRVVQPMLGGTTDEQAITDALPRAELCLAEIERLMGGGPFLLGAQPSLAGCLLVPVIHYFVMTPEGKSAMAGHPGLAKWWEVAQARPSVANTVPKLG